MSINKKPTNVGALALMLWVGYCAHCFLCYLLKDNKNEATVKSRDFLRSEIWELVDHLN